MPRLLSIPPIQYKKVKGYGGRLETSIGYIKDKHNNYYKARCETMVFDDQNRLFLLKVNKPWKYEIPGGTVELNTEESNDIPSVLSVCKRISDLETQEEANIVVKNTEYSCFYRHYTYDEMGSKSWKDWLKKAGLDVIGDISIIFTGIYDYNYTNIIEKEDIYEDMKKNGRFYSFNEVSKLLLPEHKTLWNTHIKLNKPKEPLDEVLELV